MSSQYVLEWIKNYNIDFNKINENNLTSVVSDNLNNLYTVFTKNDSNNINLMLLIILKLDENGNEIFTKTFDGIINNSDNLPIISVNKNTEEIFIVYSTGINVNTDISNTINSDIVLIKVNNIGVIDWIKQYNDKNFDYSPRIVIDSNNYIYICYYSTNPISPNQYYDTIYLIKTDEYGEIIWKNNTDLINTSGGNYYPVLDIDNENNCIVSYFNDGNLINNTEQLSGGFDIVYFKIDTNGNLIWIRQRPTFNTFGNDFYPSISIDKLTNSIYIAYYTNGNSENNVNTGDFDIVCFKSNKNGEIIWISQNVSFNSQFADLNPSIFVNGDGFIYLTSSTYGSINGNSITGSPDIVFIVLDVNGNTISHLQSNMFNSVLSNINSCIVLNNLGNPIISFLKVDDNTSNLCILKLSTIICVIGNTGILMYNGEYKKIRDINRYDITTPYNTISKICKKNISRDSIIDIIIFTKNSIGINKPTEDLIITPNHPIFFKGYRKPAKCFKNCLGVIYYENKLVKDIKELCLKDNEDLILYDIQYDYDTSYIANGIEIQSKSPYSKDNPLLENMYIDKNLYEKNLVWDSLYQDLSLDYKSQSINKIKLKNKKHKYINLIMDKCI